MKQTIIAKRTISIVLCVISLLLVTTLVCAESGYWTNLGSGTNNTVIALVIDTNGNLYAGGTFTTAGGVPADHVAMWNGTSWSALGAGTGNVVWDLAVDTQNNVFAGGIFTPLDGQPFYYVAKWNGAQWSALGSGTNGIVYSLAVDSSGNLYASGQFTTAGGVPANAIAKWDGTSWSALGSGLSSYAYDLAFDASGNLYAAGYFSSAGGVVVNGLAKWNGTAWSAIPNTPDIGGYIDLAFDSNGNLYAIAKKSVGLDNFSYLYKWDGSQWTQLANADNGNHLSSLQAGLNGSMYVGGYFTSINGVSAKSIAKWDGTNWSALGNELLGRINTIARKTDGNLYVGGQLLKINGVLSNNVARWDNSMPTVSASSPANGVKIEPTATLKVTFDEDMKSDGSAGAANNVSNYMLVEANGDGFQTTSCAAGVNALDTNITINTAVYSNNGGSGPYEATLTVNNGTALPNGNYKLFICGTTSIEDLAGNKINGGLSDETITFDIAPEALPATGFAPGVVTELPVQPEDYSYAPMSDLWLEIPKLDVQTDIVGVPVRDGDWDLTWLGSDAGWLHGTAFPTWSGNSSITGHVTDANGNPGVFAELKQLNWGDRIIVHGWGQEYVYEVREVKKYVDPTDSSDVFEHEEYPWLTLITCRGYDPDTGDYNWRLVVRAVQVAVE